MTTSALNILRIYTPRLGLLICLLWVGGLTKACLAYDGKEPGPENLLYMLIQTWGGTQQLGTAADDRASGVTTDEMGNLYIIGETGGSLGENPEVGVEKIILIKYNSVSQRQWILQLGTSLYDRAYGVTTDSAGNIYVTGSSAQLPVSTLVVFDIFLTKYNPAGQKLWRRQLGSTKSDIAYGVTTDQAGNIYITGYTSGGLDGAANQGESDVFLAKYNSSGEKHWSRQIGTASYDVGHGPSIDDAGNIYLTGTTHGNMEGGATSAGSKDLFLVKYNTAGAKQWTRQLGTAYLDHATKISIDRAGNIYVTGFTAGELDGNLNAGLVDYFLVKYNGAGARLWTRQSGTDQTEFANGVTTDQAGNIYISGVTHGELDGNRSAGGSDLFLIKYKGTGEKLWTRQYGTADAEFVGGISADRAGNIYIVGETRGNLDGNENAGGSDLFLLKYDSTGDLQ